MDRERANSDKKYTGKDSNKCKKPTKDKSLEFIWRLNPQLTFFFPQRPSTPV